MRFHLIFYNIDKDGVPSIRKISDLVITLANEKGEDIKDQTKKIGEAQKNLVHWKEPEGIKWPNQFSVSLETAITTSELIFMVELTRQEALPLCQGVYRPKVEYSLG